MAVSNFIPIQMLLDDWRRHVLDDIWYFNQVNGQGAPTLVTKPYVQPDRDMVAEYMWQAFNMLKENLAFAPCPVYEVSEKIPLSAMPNIHTRYQTRYGFLQAFGTRATTLISAGQAIVYSDPAPALGVDTLATITVNTSVAADEIQIFFQVSDGADSAASEYWQIAPAKVTKVGNVATITAPRALFVKPSMWARPYLSPNFIEVNNADTATAADFVTAVDVYRVYPNSTSAVQIYSPSSTCGDCSEVSCDVGTIIMDAQLGEFRLCNIGSCAATCWGSPMYLRISYLAGYPLTNQYIDPRLGSAVTRLADTLMPRRPCVVQDRTADVWYQDRIIQSGRVGDKYVNNPFGLQWGQVEAWKAVLHHRLGQGGRF